MFLDFVKLHFWTLAGAALLLLGILWIVLFYLSNRRKNNRFFAHGANSRIIVLDDDPGWADQRDRRLLAHTLKDDLDVISGLKPEHDVIKNKAAENVRNYIITIIRYNISYSTLQFMSYSVEDIAHDVLLKLLVICNAGTDHPFNTMDGYRQNCFLAKMIQHTLIDDYRKDIASGRRMAVSLDLPISDNLASDENVWRKVDARITCKVILDDELTKNERVVLMMRSSEYSFSEIATALVISEDSARQIFFRVRKKIIQRHYDLV